MDTLKAKAQALAQELDMTDAERADFMEAVDEQTHKDGEQWEAEGHDWLVLTDADTFCRDMTARSASKKWTACATTYISSEGLALDYAPRSCGS